MVEFKTVEITGQQVDRKPANRVETIEFKPKPVYDSFKRVFDIVSSLIVSVILLIPLGIISLMIVIKDKGSPFYFHKRIGKNHSEIKVCKLRSMKKNADDLEKMLTPESVGLVGYENPF